MNAEITPVPSTEEAVAIAAAVQAMWPVSVQTEAEVRARETGWKFSGRWWSRPSAARRDRPLR